MLKIQNYYLLCDKPIGQSGWKVEYCGEDSNFYEIKLEHKHLSSIKVYLQRKKTLHIGDRFVYRFYDESRKATNQSVTIDYIADMNNLLKALDKFTFHF
jgi:hypothetical protein